MKLGHLVGLIVVVLLIAVAGLGAISAYNVECPCITTSETSTSSATISSSNTSASITTSGITQSPIKHLIVIMQENRAFDNYFWSYPGVDGNYQTNPNYCDPQPNGSCLAPYNADYNTTQADMPHTWPSTAKVIDNGRMDGFSIPATNKTEPLGYYDGEALPYLWWYAEHYVIADHFFSSVRSYSQPNHWYLLAGTSPTVSLFEGAPQEEAVCYNQTTFVLTMNSCAYINEAQPIQTIVDELNGQGISWKYYDTPVPQGLTLSESITGRLANGGSCNGYYGTGICDAWDYWSPLRAQNRTYTVWSSYGANEVARVQLLWDIGNGTLPAVSWVIPSTAISDHAPANIVNGMYWYSEIINDVMESKYWNSTAIVLLWDDYGGWFDVVPPPNTSQTVSFSGNGVSVQNAPVGLGPRIAALIISPYAKPGFVDHTVYDFQSTLKFIEWNWGLPPLNDTQSDAQANNLLNAFNFNQPPNPPYPSALTQAQENSIASYILLGDSNPNSNGGPAQILSIVGPGQQPSQAAVDYNNWLLDQFIAGDPD